MMTRQDLARFWTVLGVVLATVLLAIAIEAKVKRAWGAERSTTSLARVIPTLAAKAQQIVAACKSEIVSTVARRANRSNHSIGKDGFGHAVDIKGNPSCIYAQLKGWPGGYSTDYGSVRCDGGKRCPHVHISYNPGGQEWGLRFVHRDPFGVHRFAAARAAERTP